MRRLTKQLLTGVGSALVFVVLITGGVGGVPVADGGAQTLSGDNTGLTDTTTTGIDSFQVSDYSSEGYYDDAYFDIGWGVSGDYDEVTVTVTNLDRSTVVETYGGAEGSETFWQLDRYGETYEIKLEATASDGSTVCETFTGPADGTANFERETCGDSGGSADIVTESADLSANTVDVGQRVDVTAEFTNQGDAAGEHTAELLVDGDVVATENVSLDAGASESIEFSRTFSESGEYTLAVDGETAGTVTVESSQVELQTDDVSLDKATVQSGDLVEINATFTNVGDASGEVSIDFVPQAVDSSGIGDDPVMPEIPDVSVQLNASETKTVTVGKSYNLERGTYEITPVFHTDNPNATFVSNQGAALEITSAPAEFTVTDATVETTSVTAGDSVQTTATVENTGGSDGTYTAELEVDGTVVDTKDVTVASGATETVSFSYTFTTAGEYTLAVGDQNAGTVSVSGGDDSGITVTDFDVSDESNGGRLSSASIGVDWAVEGADSVTVTVTNLETQQVVASYDGISGVENYTSRVAYDRAFAVKLEATSNDGSVVCKRLSGRADGTDDFEVRTGCETGQPDLGLVDMSLSDTQVNVSDAVTVDATMTNVGDAYGNRTVAIAVNGSVIYQEGFAVLPGENRTRTVRYDFDRPGEYTFTVDGETVGTVSVTRVSNADIKIRSTDVVDREIQQGESFETTVTLENVGSESGSKQLTLTTGSGTLTTESVTVSGGATRTVTLTATLDEMGDTNVDLNGEYAGTVSVLGADLDVSEYYQRLPEQADTVRVTVTYDTSGVDNQFEAEIAGLGDELAVVSSDGLETDGDTLTWDGRTADPTITLDISVTGENTAYTSDYAFFAGPEHDGVTNPLSVVDRTGTSKVTGSKQAPWETHVFMGPHQVVTESTAEQTIRLVVADAADEDTLGATPQEMLSMLVKTSRDLDVGGMDDVVTGFAVTNDVTGPAGRAWGNNFWFAQGPQTLVHEYIHTRDDISKEQEVEWLTEAIASYYGGKYTFAYGDIDYDEFRTYRNGKPVNLKNPNVWEDSNENYYHGSDVIHALDSKIRAATGNEQTFEDVFRALNGKSTINQPTLISTLEEVAGGEDFDSFFDDHVRGTETVSYDRNPDKYEFTETTAISGTLSTDAASTGIVYINSYESRNNPDLTNWLPITSSAHTYVTPDSDGSWSLDVVSGLTNAVLTDAIDADRYRYALKYAQHGTDGERYPRDGIPDLHVLGYVDVNDGSETISSLPSDVNVVTVTAVDRNGNPVEDATVTLGKDSERANVYEAAKVTAATGSDGEFAPGEQAGLELSGQYLLNIQAPDGYASPSETVFGRLDAERPENIQFVVDQTETDGPSMHGTVVPADNVSTGTEITISAMYYHSVDEPATTVTVPVYVDGEQVKSIEITADGGDGVVDIPLTFDESGNREIRVGDLPGQTVTVNGSDDGNDGEDAKPVLDTFSVHDESTQGYYSDSAEFDIDWTVTHEGDALENVTVTVRNLDESVDRETYTGASGSQTYYDSGSYWDDEYNDQFRIRIEAVDDDGDSICVEFVGPADGNSGNLERSECSTTADTSENRLSLPSATGTVETTAVPMTSTQSQPVRVPGRLLA